MRNASLQILFKILQNPHVLLTFEKVHNPLHLPRERTSERPKVVRTPRVFKILTSKCASRHNAVHFFDISTSTRRRMARERRGAESSGASMETLYYKITTLLAPLTPPGVKNVTYIITFLYPPTNIRVWGGKKCNMGIARGYTCYVTFSNPPHEQPRKYFGGGGP